MFGKLAVVGIMALLAQQAGAEVLTVKVAKKQLFPSKGVSVEMIAIDGFSEKNSALLEQVAAGYAYYAAIAIAPDEDLLKSEATSLAGNHHSTAAAEKAALAGCEAKRKKTGRKCAIVALVRPEKWENREFQLSLEATEALKHDYGRKGERAFAISPETGAWALGSGEGAEAKALSACEARGAKDCEIAVADPG